jgi:hypothetical protein
VQWRVRRLALPAAVLAGLGSISGSSAIAQTRLASLDELRGALGTGDLIMVVPEGGGPLAGRLIRIGRDDLDVRLVDAHGRQRPGPRDVTLALDAIRSLDRPRDPVRNGVMIGAGIGAAVGGALIVQALAVDRNEIDEWAGIYAGATAASVGLGAVIGWAIDAARSKPHIVFGASEPGTTVSVRPASSRGPGMEIVVTLSR